jgi:hypothetical protein
MFDNLFINFTKPEMVLAIAFTGNPATITTADQSPVS